MTVSFERITTLQFDILSTLSKIKPRSVQSIESIIKSSRKGKILIFGIILFLQEWSLPRRGALVVRDVDGNYRLTDNGELALVMWKAGFEECERRQIKEVGTCRHSKGHSA